MPIISLQRSLRRLGRIRMGQQVQTQGGKFRPAKLDTWRLTSPMRELLEAASDLYGGEVREWSNPASSDHYELITEADALDVIIPPGDMAFSQWFELWSGGGCQRRCDGVANILTGEACLCPPDPAQRQALAVKGEACKPTTRLFVVLPRLPDVGMWHMESHGFFAATELAGSVEFLQRMGGLIPATLRIEQRRARREGELRQYAVPVIELHSITPAAVMSGAELAPAKTPAPALLAPSGEVEVPLLPEEMAPTPAAETIAESSVRAMMSVLEGQRPVDRRRIKERFLERFGVPPAQLPVAREEEAWRFLDEETKEPPL
jgi:hypothetical protein